MDYHILLKYLEHYGNRINSNNRYLKNRKQFVSVNRYTSNLADVKGGVPHGLKIILTLQTLTVV